MRGPHLWQPTLDETIAGTAPSGAAGRCTVPMCGMHAWSRSELVVDLKNVGCEGCVWAARNRIVALLRAAAESGGIAGSYQQQYRVDVATEMYRRGLHPIWDVAVKMRERAQIFARSWSSSWPPYEDTCRYAADRVEAGEWPVGPIPK